MTTQRKKEQQEIRTVFLRLKAASAGDRPLTRQAAAQFSRDLSDWQRWQSDPNYHDDLPRLPRRIRVGLSKTVKTKSKKAPTEKIILKNAQKPTPCTTKQRDEIREQLDWLVADQSTCLGIALAITQDSHTAEDVLSACTESAVEQIQAGRCRARCAEEFYAWVHTIVRRNAQRRAGQPERFVEYQEHDTQADSDFKDERTWGVSKRLPHADDQQF